MMYRFRWNAVVPLLCSAAAALLAAGCGDSTAPERRATGVPSFVETGPQPAIRGVGTLGTGTATPESNLQEFDFAVAADLTGRLFYRDWRFGATITVDPTDPATGITEFRDRASTCATPANGAEFDAIGRRESGDLLSFTVVACDDGAAGSGADGFSINTVTQYSNAGRLTSGDIVKTVVESEPTTSTLSITTSTTGESQPTSYTLTVTGPSFPTGTSVTIGANATEAATVTAGDYTVELGSVPTNCTVSGGATRTVTVPSGGTATVSYSVSCITPNRAPIVNAGSDQTVLLGLLYTLNASFTDPDNGPWSYTINWGDGSSTSATRSSEGTISGGHNYLLPGSYTIRVTVVDSRGASGSDTKVLTVLVDIDSGLGLGL